MNHQSRPPLVASDEVRSCAPACTFSLEKKQLQNLNVVILSGSRLLSLIPRTMTSVLLGLRLSFKATELSEGKETVGLVPFFEG